MPRWLIVLSLVVLVCTWTATAVLTRKPAEGPAPHTYEVEVDNAFGLTDGADLKLGGVRAGVIEHQRLNQHTLHALVEVHLTVPGFDSLRRDATCQVRPQSLIGESYLDCQPGTGVPLPAGGRVPVSQTGSAIGIDLLNTILRRPYNERLRILLGELGAAVAGRGEDINVALRRSLPALRQTNRVLAVLASERETLANLARNGDRSLAELDRRRRDLGRFVDAAGRLSEVSAHRTDRLAGQFERFPGFLDQVPPSLGALGQAADAQAGALQELGADAPRLTAFAQLLGRFSTASQPAVRALGAAAQVGTVAARQSRPVLGELEKSARGTPELARNLRFITEHLDDRANAVEPDGRSPGGKGFTGLEALLQYVFNQSTSINVFDRNSYMLKVNLLSDPVCGKYADADYARAHPQCAAGLGPTQPGVTSPDPTAGAPAARASAAPAARAPSPASSGVLDYLLKP